METWRHEEMCFNFNITRVSVETNVRSLQIQYCQRKGTVKMVTTVGRAALSSYLWKIQQEKVFTKWKYHKMCETASKCSLAQSKHVLKSTSHIGLQWRSFAHTSNRIYVGQTNLGCMWTPFRKNQIVDKCCVLLHTCILYITVLANASSVGLPWVGQSSIHLLQMVEHNQRYIFFCIEYK